MITPRERRAINAIAKHAFAWFYAIAAAALIFLAQHPAANDTGAAPPASTTARASK